MIDNIAPLDNLTSPRLRWLASAARIALWVTVAFWLLFGATWAALHGWIVPRIEEFRPRLEIEASKALGATVRIGQITAQSGGLIPSFELRDIVLLDAQGREALHLSRVLAALSPSSLWSRGFEQLFIDQPTLEIRRAPDGKVYVGGLDVSQTSTGNPAIADWVFSQAELSIKGGSIRWTDELRTAPPLTLTQVDVIMRNGLRSHAMRLDATPPPEWGERFNLRGIFRQPLLSRHAGQWTDWSGQLFAEFSRVDVSHIKQYASLQTLGVDIKTGNGSLRAWADVSKGRVSAATFDMALADVDAQLGKTLKPLALTSVAGRFGGRQLANGFEFTTQGLRFDTQDGLRWPGGNLSVTSSGTAGETDQAGELKADRLDLAAVAEIANRLPLGAATHAAIVSYAPQGLVEAVEARWQMPVNGALTFAAKGRVTGLNVAALPSLSYRSSAPHNMATSATATSANMAQHQQPGRPGVSGATVDFDLTQAAGKALVKIVQGHLDLPGVFEDPRVVFDRLSMDAQWKLSGEKIALELRDIKFAAPDAEGTAQASWRSGDSKPGAKDDSGLGVLDLQGVLSRGNGARVHRYLPLVLLEPVRHYVRDAVVQGDVSDVRFVVKGPVDEIPFSNPAKGEFKISANVKNGTFAYVPRLIQSKDAMAWPALNDVNGELVFHRAALEINGATAKVLSLPGLQIVKADARIPDLMRSATLDVSARLKGPLGDALGFVNTSPIASMMGNALGKAVASGAGDYAIRLSLPLNAVDKTKVQGTVSLPGNDVQFTPETPALSRLKGVVAFSEGGFNVATAQARLLGGDIRFEGGMRPANRTPPAGTDLDASVMFKAQGSVTAEGIRQAKDIGIASRLAQNANGSASYAATLGFTRGLAELVVTSNLQGMALSLPAPLSKTAESQLPIRFENTLLRDTMAPGQKLQDQLVLSVGRIASVQYVRDVSGPEPRVLRGAMAVGLEAGESAPLPDKGVAANINLATVNLDAWEKVFSSTVGSGTSTAVQPSAQASTSALAQTYLPTQIAIRAKELLVGGRKLSQVVVGGTREGQTWRANMDATELNGYFEFSQAGLEGAGGAGGSAGRVFARLSRLRLGQSTANEVESILEEQPANIPALDIVVDDMELRGKKLGRIEIDAVNRNATREGGAREWRLNKFNVIMPEAALTATGNWVAINAQAPGGAPVAGPRVQRAAAERRRTVMNFKLDILDSGELLKRFGMVGVIRRGKGKMEGQVAWIGSPLSLDYPSMSGQFNVNIESGQFLKADPGIAKLLGVLSLQSLPRRLALDFRDVFSEGFAFDFVRGDVNITQGIAATNNLQMKGVNAAVLMEGSADIAKETQDLKVVVVPEINAGTASLITAVINPVVGLGTFLAQYFLRQPLIKASTQEFHIDGSWADPKITKVTANPATGNKPNAPTN